MTAVLPAAGGTVAPAGKLSGSAVPDYFSYGKNHCNQNQTAEDQSRNVHWNHLSDVSLRCCRRTVNRFCENCSNFLRKFMKNHSFFVKDYDIYTVPITVDTEDFRHPQ